MFALISPNEKTGAFQRIAEVAEQPFPVATPLHWVAAPVGTTLDGHAYDPATQSFVDYVPDSEQMDAAQTVEELLAVMPKE